MKFARASRERNSRRSSAISFNETTLTQFSYFRYVISFRDGSRIVPLSPISAAFVNSRLRNVGETRVHCDRQHDGPTLRVSPSPFLCPVPLIGDLFHRLPFLSSLSVFFFFTASRPHLFFIFRRQIRGPRLTITMSPTLTLTLRGMRYTLIHYSTFFLTPRHAYS